MQRHLNRIDNGKRYYKYVVVIPSAAIERLNWSEKVRDLNFEIKGPRLTLKPASK